jgi:hypothetical protein
MKGIPVGARVVMAITKVSNQNTEKVGELTALLVNHPSVDRVLTLPLSLER